MLFLPWLCISRKIQHYDQPGKSWSNPLIYYIPDIIYVMPTCGIYHNVACLISWPGRPWEMDIYFYGLWRPFFKVFRPSMTGPIQGHTCWCAPPLGPPWPRQAILRWCEGTMGCCNSDILGHTTLTYQCLPPCFCFYHCSLSRCIHNAFGQT